jgi:hypothetical protein
MCENFAIYAKWDMDMDTDMYQDKDMVMDMDIINCAEMPDLPVRDGAGFKNKLIEVTAYF